MSAKQAKRRRRELRAQGIDPNPAPVHNPLPEEAEDTRAERRKKKYRKRAYRVELEQTSHRQRMLHIAKWRAVFSKKKTEGTAG